MLLDVSGNVVRSTAFAVHSKARPARATTVDAGSASAAAAAAASAAANAVL